MFPIHFDLTWLDLIRLNPTNLIIIPGLLVIGAILIMVASVKKFA